MIIREGSSKVIAVDTPEVCWRCGKEFNKNILKDHKTYHHSIKQMWKPKYNIKLPICQDCHYEMNNEELQATKIIATAKTVITRLNKLINETADKKTKKDEKALAAIWDAATLKLKNDTLQKS